MNPISKSSRPISRVFSSGGRFRSGWWRYAASLLACLTLGLLLGWTDLARSLDLAAYDFLFRLHEPEPVDPSEAILLSIDEASLQAMGGRRGLRPALAWALSAVAAARPRAVGIDLILVDEDDADSALDEAFGRTPGLILGADIQRTGGWEQPLPRFRRHAKAVGHTHATPDPVSRHLPLMKAQGRERLWALSLEVWRAAHGNPPLTEGPNELALGPLTIPASATAAYPLWVRYRPSIAQVSLEELRQQPGRAREFAGKAVFVGFTALSDVKDRLVTPVSAQGTEMPGVEIHAHAYETLRRGRFLKEASHLAVVGAGLAIVILSGLIFFRPPSAVSYAAGGALLLAVHALPHAAFRWGDLIFPTVAPVSVAWLAVITAAVYQYFILRARFRQADTERTRYKQAIHFVTHEMRSPLTAIQGSSELMSRYSLSDDKRKQMASMINAESKRLARMITTFLDIERISDGSSELRRDEFVAGDAVRGCVERVRPLADRKGMAIEFETPTEIRLAGDRELIEYAVYNLLTNAVKYSPEETVVTVTCVRDGESLRIAVRDQGMGLDEKEQRAIFEKFYRTKRAEAAGIEGTGIGLSLVSEIAARHDGRVEVASRPGSGSCFTLVLPALATAAAEAPQTA